MEKNILIFMLVTLSQHVLSSPAYTNHIQLNPGHLSAKQEQSWKTEGLKDPDEEEWCDPILGCLDMSGDWRSGTRPINHVPQSREEINTQFYLSTRLQPETHPNYVISADNMTTLSTSTFDGSKPTKLIVHGFVDSGNSRWTKELTEELLTYGDYNVIRVDWHKGSRSKYSMATADTRVVGLEIGHLVNTLKSSYGLNPADVHCIGHSLGAHACGYGGEQIDKMGRISGMDPAGPYFTGTPTYVHLDPSDALFVDNIHTDADSIFVLGYGTAQPMGNIDFYPNSGHDQPGCDSSSVMIDWMLPGDLVDDTRDVFACSHIRAVSYFIESIRSPDCTWIGQECHDYETFQNGQCYTCGDDGSRCAYLGIRADEYVQKSRQLVAFYLDTDKKEPFCMQQYEVSILTDAPKDAEPWVMGKLFISVYGDNSEIIEKLKITDDHERIDHGRVKKLLFTSHTDISHAVRIELKWVYDDHVLNPGTYCWSPFCNRSLYVRSVQLTPINKYPESERLSYTALTCSYDGSTVKIKDGHTESFMTSDKCESPDGH